MHPSQTRLNQIYAALNEYSSECGLQVEKFTVESLIASHRRVVEHSKRLLDIQRKHSMTDLQEKQISVEQLSKLTLLDIAKLITDSHDV